MALVATIYRRGPSFGLIVTITIAIVGRRRRYYYFVFDLVHGQKMCEVSASPAKIELLLILNFLYQIDMSDYFYGYQVILT